MKLYKPGELGAGPKNRNYCLELYGQRYPLGKIAEHLGPWEKYLSDKRFYRTIQGELFLVSNGKRLRFQWHDSQHGYHFG